ncbi:unnamed protein product [Eruca vesicaria subsp. sativa]|uniref:Uncharacterized protein n=1 Tax=Eruca vesicaria subsp. sativa TaxID=29727 RepID=A0ABC8LHK1_ERUVS|nr:unnamed protein product [Eruca vesicaria subsp. sativa]
MATYKSPRKLDLQSPAVEFIEHLTRKKNHVSLFFAAVDLRFEVELKDSQTMTVNILGNLISGSYKTVTATFTVGEDTTASCLTYTFEFEKIKYNVNDAKIVESLVTYIYLSDVTYKTKVKHNSIDAAGYPPEECFKDFVNAFEVDDEVKMGGVDWQKKTFTISVPSMMENFETIKVTITVIPKNQGSRVKWTIEVEKIEDYTEEPDYFLFVVCSIRRLHATNHPYQRYGPKGFMEIKVLPRSADLYVRVDLPGVPDNAIRYRVDAVRQKLVFFSGEESLRVGVKAEDVREYSGSAGLGCDCCQITGVDAKMKDGVLRMIVSRVNKDRQDNKCTHFVPPNAGKSGRYDYRLSSDERYKYDVNSFNMDGVVEEHPFVVKGHKDVLALQQTSDGCVHFSVDMPGVCGDDMFLLPNENEIKFYGENKEVYEHDESCRIFIGAVDKRACCAYGIPLLEHNIAWDAEFGVLKVRVTPPPRRNNNN